MDKTPWCYLRITRRFIDKVAALGRRKTSRRSGQELAGALFARMANRLAGTLGPPSDEQSFEVRFSDLIAFLNSEGFDFELERRAEPYVISSRSSPCPPPTSKQALTCRGDA
jgi:hypothetical protein